MEKALYYKTEDDKDMLIKFFTANDKKAPLVVFFFGGGWMNGNMDRFKPHALELEKLGYVVAIVDYRVYSKHGTTFDYAMKDAFYALKYLSDNALELKIDINNVFYGGGSAGGHLAIASVMFNNVKNNFNVRGLVCFNPVVDTTEKGFMSDASTKQSFKPVVYSPYHHVTKNLPDIIIFHGTEDTVMPYQRTLEFADKYRKYGNNLEFVSYEGCKHSFHNIEEYYTDTLEKTKVFIKEHII
ncbi:MAG: alpha/beta hydrolase [Clostridia bacterium]